MIVLLTDPTNTNYDDDDDDDDDGRFQETTNLWL